MGDKLARIRKALVAGGTSFATTLAAAAPDGTLDGKDFASAAGIGLLTGILTWAVPNKPVGDQQ